MNVVIRIYKKLLQSSRLIEYEQILKYAIGNGYTLCSLYEWYESSKNKKQLVLRHDVDIDVQGARRMFEIEKSLGVKATYYFRRSTKDNKLIQEMQDAGFETGLHYETIADYCKVKNILSADSLKEIDYSKCKDILIDEINQWESDHGILHSICAHGDKRNRLIKVPNRILFDTGMREETKVLFDACDVDLMDKVDEYISDTSIVNHHKWKQGKSPMTAIDERANTIMLLTHPIHWNYNLIKNVRSLYRGFREDNLDHVYEEERLKAYL